MLDYRLTPKLVATLEGQGSETVSGLEIPLKIRGPWARPSVAPDLQGVLQNPEVAAKSLGDLVNKAGKKIKSRKVKDLLDGVLGDGDGQSGENNNNALGGLLGDLLQQ